MSIVVLRLLFIICRWGWFHLWVTPASRHRTRRRRLGGIPIEIEVCTRRKPEWVRRSVMRLAVRGLSCRQIAHHFNRRFGQRVTIGKSWVAQVVREQANEIEYKRRVMRRRLPVSVPVNHAWALDLSFYASPEGVRYTVLGVIDHGSRRLLCLKQLPRKCTLTLLGHLLLVMAKFGMPAVIRTDNEPMFTSRLWVSTLLWLGVRHRRSALGSPWQNGRIERLFGTLKPLLKKIRPASVRALKETLEAFSGFYNHVRVHQNLSGLTPMEAWQGKTLAEVQRAQATQAGQWVSALGGLMVGYYVRC